MDIGRAEEDQMSRPLSGGGAKQREAPVAIGSEQSLFVARLAPSPIRIERGEMNDGVEGRMIGEMIGLERRKIRRAYDLRL